MKKKYSHLIICVIIILLLFVSPPVMFVKGIPVLGKSTEKFKGAMEHYADYDNNFPNNRQYYAADFEHFYFVNLRFWERIEIEQLEYYQQEVVF